MDSVHLPSDDELNKALAELSLFVQNDALLSAANFSDSFLKRTLWAKHCNALKSKKLLKSYAEWHAKHLGSASARLSIAQVHPFMLTGILQAPTEATDKDGMPIVYMRPNIYRPDKIHYHYVINALVYLLEYLTSGNEIAAKYGFTFICDMKNWGWQNFGAQYASHFFNILSGRFPVRIRRFVLVNAPMMFPMVWRLIKPMMSADLASKFVFVEGKNIETIADKSVLPVELGGTHTPMDMVQFVKEQYAKEGSTYSDVDMDKVDWKTHAYV